MPSTVLRRLAALALGDGRPAEPPHSSGTPTHPHLPYQPALDGLRALAVAAILDRMARTEVTNEESGVAIPVSANIGLAVHLDDDDAVYNLIELADARMYAAKRQRPIIRPHVA